MKEKTIQKRKQELEAYKKETEFVPSIQQLKLFYKVLEHIKEGNSVKDAVKATQGISEPTFWKMENSDTDLESVYRRAREIRGIKLAEETITGLEKVPEVIVVNGMEQQNTVGLAKANHIANNKRWLAGKLNKGMSDKGDVNTNIQVNTIQPIQIVRKEDNTENRIDAIIESED